ncbi:hypothetical protein ACPEIF_28100 [Streptomyces sp. NPDC012600]|uniref:hypothetical protein n=1 Tax=Streptomyces sp. NPDC012600 TaxID=3415005 RepID=UPI003C2FA27E
MMPLAVSSSVMYGTNHSRMALLAQLGPQARVHPGRTGYAVQRFRETLGRENGTGFHLAQLRLLVTQLLGEGRLR